MENRGGSAGIGFWGFGSMLDITISWSLKHSILWTILHGILSWRMRKRYGREVNASEIDLTTADPWAFNLWGSQSVGGVPSDPEDRKIQYDFWRRYIGNTRSRLAWAFRRFFLPVALYQENRETVVENKIPVADLKKLYEELPTSPLMVEDEQSLHTMRRSLDGDFKNGFRLPDELY